MSLRLAKIQSLKFGITATSNGYGGGVSRAMWATVARLGCLRGESH
jgi:hypothetical protein